MRLDIYRRAEHDGLFSYLAVPEKKSIPEEAVNTDWEIEQEAIDLDDGVQQLPNYGIEQPHQQIADKGYAITRLKM